jgi:hypothetical protein
LHIDYFEIYFRNTVAPSGPNQDDDDGKVFVGKAEKGTAAVSIAIDAVPEGGIAYDILLLAGKKQPGGAVLMANAYIPAYTIMPNTTNTININVVYLKSRVHIYSVDGTTTLLTTASNVTKWRTIGGLYQGVQIPHDASAHEIADDTEIYPVLNVDGLSPLYRAWGGTAESGIDLSTSDWVSAATAKYWLEPYGHASEVKWGSTNRVSNPITRLNVRYGHTHTANDAMFIFQPADPVTISPGADGSPDINNVLNTFGRLYAVVPFKAFGPVGAFTGDQRGITWYIQGGAANYYRLQGKENTENFVLFGGELVAFGGKQDDGLGPGTGDGTDGDFAGFPLTELTTGAAAEEEATAIEIIIGGL